jgi:DNA invertase Pin-like site-specific DNA recombinase
MVEEAVKKETKKKFGAVKGQKRKKYPPLDTQQIKEIIDLLQDKTNSQNILKKYNISPSLLNRIKTELRKERRVKGDYDGLPKNYYVVRSIGDRVNNILYDRGYVKVEK